MKHYRQQPRRLSQKAPAEPTFKIGDQVFFHAHAHGNKNTVLLCEGLLQRLPTQQSPVYKAFVVRVCELSLSGEVPQKDIKNLLGEVIPVPEVQKGMTDWMKMAYAEALWLEVRAHEKNKKIAQLRTKIS